MKLLLTICVFTLSFLASAETTAISNIEKQAVVESFLPGPGKQKRRSDKRINKRRKRKCKQFGRRSFAG